MASSESKSRAEASAAEPRSQLQVSAYDRVASMLVTLLLLIGAAVGLMFLVFLTMRIVSAPHAVPLELMEDLDSTAALEGGGGGDFEEPGLEEMQELPQPDLMEMTEAVTDAVTTRPAALDTFDGDTDATGRGRGRGRGDGPPGLDVIPFGRRTKIQYGETSLDTYAAILDYFGIELAAAGGGKATVDYAAKFSQTKPATRSGSSQEETRVYLIWRRGSRLEEMDRKLLTRAGIETKDRQLMQFLPPQVTATLRRLEAQRAGGQDERMLRMTVYGIEKKGNAYEFYVLDQQYRTPR